MARPLNSASSGGPKELLSMTIDIGDGRSDTLKISEKDVPSDLARQFAQKHSLSALLERDLTTLIQQHKETAELRVSASVPSFRKSNDGVTNGTKISAFGRFQGQCESQRPAKQAKPQQEYNEVQERLYGKGGKSGNSAKRTKSAATLNYGEWLHLKGSRMKESKEQRLVNTRSGTELQLKSEVCPFQPTINEYSTLLAPRYFEKPEDVLMRQANQYKDRLEEKKEKALQDELKECAFNPTISRKSKTLSQSKDGFQVHEGLYQDAAERRAKREVIRQTSTQLNESPKTKKMAADAQEELANRLINEKQEIETKKEQARLGQMQKEGLLPQSPSDAKQLFHPETGRNPKAARLSDGQNIHEYLYAKREDRRKKFSEQSAKSQQHLEEAASATKTNDRTTKIFDEYRGKQYARLFSLMDNDDDGEISANAISLDAFDTKTLEILTPLFRDMDEGVVLDLTGFVSKLEELWKGLNVEQRANLIKREDKNDSETLENLSLSISPATYKFAGEKQKLMSSDIYDRLCQSQKLRDLKTLKSREMSEQETLKACTFKPKILKMKKNK